MLHEMKLNESPFERIKNGTKTIEFRLFDEKRQKIKVGDKIPEIIDSNTWEKSHYRILADNEYLTELNKKILEETNEFQKIVFCREL